MITLESIATKVQASRPVTDVRGKLITLSNQQRHVIVRMCRDGATLKRMANDLGESLGVIKHLQASAMRTIGIGKAAQLGVWAAKMGLV